MSIYDLKVKTRDGKVVKRFDPTFKQEDMEEDIKGLLQFIERSAQTYREAFD